MIFLKNASYINWETLEIKKKHICIDEGEDGKIQFLDVWPSSESLQNNTVIDCNGNYVTRSFVCGHHHVYSALACGMGKPAKNPENFYDILKYIWWTLDKCLNKEMIEASAYVTAIECAKNGTTFVIDHHASPNAIEGSLDIIANVFEKVGLGHLLCYEITDRDGVDFANRGLAETEKYLRNRQGLVGLHASFTLTNATLKNAVNLAKKYNTGVHVHIAEDLYDQDNCYELYNKRVVERFEEFGMLKLQKSIFVHCLYLTPGERNLIKDSGIFVTQNPDSNMNNNVGYFRSHCLGSNIMLGTDGMHSDMLRSMKMAFLAGQSCDQIDMNGAYQRLRNTHKYLELNNFKGDGQNNLIILDYNPPTLLNSSNLLAHLIFSIQQGHIKHVISKGKVIVKDRKITTVNEVELYESSRAISKELWQRMKKVKHPLTKG